MKKNFLYALVTLLVCTVSANAQKLMTDDDFIPIPSFFTYDHKPYICMENGNENGKDIDGYFIYDTNLNLVETVNTGECVSLDLELYIDKNGISFDLAEDDIYLTQTFFNDDADWEYMSPVYETITDEYGSYEDVISYSVKKADGTVIGNIPIKIEIDGLSTEWYGDVYVINDVVYTSFIYIDYSGYDNKYYLFTLPEFRKLITGNANDVKPVPAMVKTVSKEAYDLSGRKARNNRKGIIIKDNKKMLVK